MIGFFDYTVWLTYLSLISAAAGIVVTLLGEGHPFFGCVCLLLSGLFDAFDGKVARTKKDRTRQAMNYGIQIDSLADIVAFGVLPTCIGASLIRTSPTLAPIIEEGIHGWRTVACVFLFAVMVVYVLAAMIRLAYFNVTEQERQETESGARTYYLGLPVTSAALIFPILTVFQYLFAYDFTIIYILALLIVAFLFIFRFKVQKPSLRGLIAMVIIGALEFIILSVWRALVG